MLNIKILASFCLSIFLGAHSANSRCLNFFVMSEVQDLVKNGTLTITVPKTDVSEGLVSKYIIKKSEKKVLRDTLKVIKKYPSISVRLHKVPGNDLSDDCTYAIVMENSETREYTSQVSLKFIP